MNKQAILHIPMSQYAHGLDDDTIVFRLRGARGDLKQVQLIYGDRSCRNTPVDYFYAEMSLVAYDLLHDWFEVTLKSPFKRVCYGFRLTDQAGETTLYYGDQFNESLTIDRSEYFQLPYNHRSDRADVPEWMKDAIVYNIFPDSFATGKRCITDLPTTARHDGLTVHGKRGGTIRGIMENLDYLQDLGVNCIYMNPIFAAGEYHKYDLIDYYHIDPAFGTDEEFRLLVKTAHDMGIRVMIDGVFNHCGWKFFAFRDVIEHGKASRYWDWFFRLQEPVIVPDNMEDYPTYECFGYERMMPKMATDNPEVQKYFCDVGVHWVKEYDIDGWRLDVASEVNDGFWRAFRNAVKAVKPDCALIGEVWETACHWLDGSMFDSTMNYDFRRHCKRFFANEDIDAQGFNARVTDMLMRYRRPVLYGQLNLLDSHDVSRFLSLCGSDKRKMRLAILFQMTFAGMPCVFYGDEQGITGILEDEYRHPMVWNQMDELHDFYRQAMHLRKTESALRSGNFRCVFAGRDNGLYIYSRSDEGQKITIAMNRSEEVCHVQNKGEILWQSGWKDGILEPYGFLIYKE